MNIKVKAAAIVAGIAVSALVGILTVQLAFTYIPIQVLGMFGALVVLSFMLSLVYTVVLARLKYESELKNITKK
jgi:hypothetical protein